MYGFSVDSKARIRVFHFESLPSGAVFGQSRTSSIMVIEGLLLEVLLMYPSGNKGVVFRNNKEDRFTQVKTRKGTK